LISERTTTLRCAPVHPENPNDALRDRGVERELLLPGWELAAA